MQMTHMLQDFGSAVPGAETLQLVTEVEREAQSAATYEKGYDAGWEDALTARQKDQTTLSTELRENLQDLDFTLAEARRLVTAEFAPVIGTMLTSVLPPLLREQAIPMILQEVERQSEGGIPEHIALIVAPGDRDRLAPIIGTALGETVAVVEDATLGNGQIAIRLGEAETIFDPERFLHLLQDQFQGFSGIVNQERSNG